jgi:hypothetical protein
MLMNRKKTKAKRRAKFPHWSKRRIDNRYEEFRQRQRANWSELVPEIAFVLLKCRATRERAHMFEIANESVATYPGSFDTYFGGRKVPDYALILLTLAEAKKREWQYAAGDWFKGWRLTRKGAAFARDVQRRRDARLQWQLAA